MAITEKTLDKRFDQLEMPPSDASVTDRLRYLITRMRKTQAQFAELIGVEAPNFSRILNGHVKFTDAMANRIVVNLGVSKDWLLYGTDVPFPRVDTSVPTYGDNDSRELNQRVGAPVYDIDATAGAVELSRMFTNENIIGYLNLPEVNPRNAIIRVSGESMIPQIANGAYVSVRPIGADSPIFWGQTYLVVLDDYRMVKVIRRHTDPGKVILHSNNPAYDDMEVGRDQIKGLFLVEAVLNYDILM